VLFWGEKPIGILPGQYWDEETGLHYNFQRYYDPEFGRYLSNDPAGLKGGQNKYRYARNNPLHRIDPYGLVDLNLFNSVVNHDIYTYASSVKSPHNTYTIGGHADADGIIDQFGFDIPVTKLRDMILTDPAYKRGMVIIIYACNLGNGSYAQKLSSLLGARVLAANNFVWYSGGGNEGRGDVGRERGGMGWGRTKATCCDNRIKEWGGVGPRQHAVITG
jgi:RHS repeat-associated protein